MEDNRTKREKKSSENFFILMKKIIKIIKKHNKWKEKKMLKERNEFMNYLIVFGADKALKF